MINALPYIKEVSTISNIYTYNPLVWKWIDEKFDIKWMYLLCFIFVDTAFLLCGADMDIPNLINKVMRHGIPVMFSNSTIR